MKVLRRAGFAFFGVFNGTEPNPEFSSEIAEAVEESEATQETPIVLICQSGGSLEPTTSMKNGKQSR